MWVALEMIFHQLIIVLQERLPALIGTRVPVLWLPLRPICLASTTIFASDEPGVIALSVTLHIFTQPPPHLPSVSVLQAQALLLQVRKEVCALELQPSTLRLQVIQDLETIWTLSLFNQARELLEL